MKWLIKLFRPNYYQKLLENQIEYLIMEVQLSRSRTNYWMAEYEKLRKLLANTK